MGGTWQAFGEGAVSSKKTGGSEPLWKAGKIGRWKVGKITQAVRITVTPSH
jgi:hypothetical protein